MKDICKFIDISKKRQRYIIMEIILLPLSTDVLKSQRYYQSYEENAIRGPTWTQILKQIAISRI